MAPTRRNVLYVGAGALAAHLVVRASMAQSYPSGPVRIVVGFPAGGPVDIAARFIAPWLSQRLGQPFVVDNRPGESSNTATREVVRAAPDGRTLLLCGPVNPINTSLFSGLDFDFARDIVPVASISRVPLVVEVHPSVPARNVPEFLALAKDRPGQLKVAYSGNGTPQHVGIELFKMMAAVDLTLVPYLGSAPALADLLSGRADAMFDPLPSSIGHIRAGSLIPLAVTTAAPSQALPGVPAMSDFVPGYETGSWFGLGTPRGTPEPVVDRLNQEVNAALADPVMRARLADMGATPAAGSPAEFARFIASETARYRDVVRKANIRPG